MSHQGNTNYLEQILERFSEADNEEKDQIIEDLELNGFTSESITLFEEAPASYHQWRDQQSYDEMEHFRDLERENYKPIRV